MPSTRHALGPLVAGTVVVGSLLAGCSSGSSAPPTTAHPPAVGLDTALHRLVATPGGPPGAIAVVQAGDRSTVLSAGVADVATRRPLRSTDVFRLASVSKAYSAAIALALVSQRKLSLSDTIGQRLPELPAAWSSVTLAQLLQHTSGLPDYIKNQTFLAALQANPQVSMTPTQLLGYVSGDPLNFSPGSRYEYSDSDNIVVGLMVEAAAGTSYDAALRADVTGPLHLAKTALPDNAGLSEPYIHGYAVEAGQAPEDQSMALNPALAWASGGMVATVSELNQFMRAYVGGHLFGQAARSDQFHFVAGSSGPPGPGTNASGLGVFRYQTSCGTVYGHTGNYPGYTVLAAASRDGTRSVTVVASTQLNDRPVTPAFTALRHAELLGVCAALA